MKKNIYFSGVIFLLAMVCFCGCGKENDGKIGINNNQESTGQVRIGYVNNTVINAHVGLILKNSNILENNLLTGEVKSYDTDDSLLDAFDKGVVDVAVTMDFPGLKFLAKNPKGLILGSLGSLGMVALVVRSDISVNSIKDLKGSGIKIGVPVASNTHFHLSEWVEKERISPGRDISVVNSEKANLKTLVDAKKIDGTVFFGEEVLMYEPSGLYRRIADNRYRSLIIINKEFYNKNKKHTKNLLISFKEACYYLSRNSVEINNMVSKEGKIPGNLIASWSSYNTNYRARAADKINISAASFLLLWTKQLQYFYKQKITENVLDLQKVINPELQKEAEQKLSPSAVDLSKIKLKSSP